MKLKKTYFFLTAMLTVSPIRAREKSDVIVMKNGDRITCEVKSLSSNTLYISVDYILNTLSLDWTKVDHIDSKQLFLVRTRDGTVHTGTLSTPATLAGQSLQIDIVESPDKKVTLERAKVVAADQTSEDIRQRLNGQLGLGSTYTKGNQTGQYQLNSSIGYVEERWSAKVSYNSNLTSSSGSSVATRNQISLQAIRFLRWNNWYATGLTTFLQSSVQGIQLQDTFGGGIGRNIVNSGSSFITAYGGFAWQQINYQQSVIPAHTQHVTAALVGTEVKLFKFNKTTLTVSANVLPALSEAGRAQFNLNTSYYVKLWGKLNWNFTFYGNWDNRPPPGFVGSDYGASSGLSVSFGNQQR